jgi:hypothetical protein
MVAAALLRANWMRPPLVLPVLGPPWEISVRVPARALVFALWPAALLGGCGVIGALIAARRGDRLPVRTLVAAAAIACLVFLVTPPAGSTDSLDYATYGRIAALGHSPYVMTPYHLRQIHDAFTRSVPRVWQHQVSIYGPLATAEQFVAAKLGGVSAARIVFWLKLINVIAFGAVAFAADRLLRANPLYRTRALVLWTANPLLLWGLIAAGHVDVLAAAAGVAGLLMLAIRPKADHLILRALAAGALIGVAADIKISYALFGLGLAWALRRSPAALLSAAGGAAVVLLPGYAWFGLPAIRAILHRDTSATYDNFYYFIYHALHTGKPVQIIAVAFVVMACLAVLAVARLPDVPGRPGIAPALALSLAWLFAWPYQYPWYDTMAICLLIFYPVSLVDWLVLARLTALSITAMPGNPGLPHPHLATEVYYYTHSLLAPLVLLAAAIGLAWLAITGRWQLVGPDSALAGPAGLAGPVTQVTDSPRV